MKNKKGFGPQGIIILIIGIVVLGAIVLGFVKFDIFGEIKNYLPDFSGAKNDVETGIDIDFDPSSLDDSAFLDFKSNRIEEDVLKALEYAKSNEIVDRKCNCGSECENYAEWIVGYSDKNGIFDALILVSLMMQESSCQMIIGDEGASYGLMQINTAFKGIDGLNRGHCGKYGLPENVKECQEVLLTNPEKNIEVGARILKESYSISDSFYNSKIESNCNNENYKKKYLAYTGWQKALRLYNGPACRNTAESNYVEQVVARYNKLHEVLNE